MRISSASPPPQAVVPDPTPSAVAPISTSTSTRATPEPQRAERTDATGAQIKQGNPSQKTSLSRLTLQDLPNETLMMIAGHSSDSTRLALRGVSKHLREIAQTKTSATQNFIFANGTALQALGYDAGKMEYLATRPAAEQSLVLEHGAALQALGYDAGKMGYLATRPAAEQSFVLEHGKALLAL
ncbi:F-box protein, partial [Pseudomonas sp. GL-B-16]|uniref:F-box protein n=1 Tax=Pseudomonas sp. GL-B-16 TaxID=2832373 RepID=UPI001CBB1D28